MERKLINRGGVEIAGQRQALYWGPDPSKSSLYN